MANNQNLKHFVKGQIGNPAGRPKKSFSLLNEELKKEGYEPVTRNVLLEAYSLLIGLDESKIKELASDKTQPLVIRLIIKDLVGENSAKAIQDMRNYSFGNATQPVEHSGEVRQLVTLFEIPKNGRDEGS